MNYDIKIRGDDSDNGMLEFDRLNLLTANTKDIATKALMLKLRGFSGIAPSKEIKKALAIRLQHIEGNRLEGTSLQLDADFFSDTMKQVQFHLFRPTEDLLSLTPMSLVIGSFRSALVEQEDKDNLDKPLLESLVKFKKAFVSSNEVFLFSNRGTVAEVEVTLDDFKKIERLQESIPNPKRIIISGKLDEMKHSKSKLVLITADGPVNAFAQQPKLLEKIPEYFGKEITLAGMAHFKPGGKLSYVEVQDYAEPGKAGKFFSAKPHAMSVQEQITLQLKQGKSRNPLSEIEGKWPGDESIEDLLSMLD